MCNRSSQETYRCAFEGRLMELCRKEEGMNENHAQRHGAAGRKAIQNRFEA